MKMFIPNSPGPRVTVEEVETEAVHDLEITESGNGRAYHYVYVPQRQTQQHIPTDLEEK